MGRLATDERGGTTAAISTPATVMNIDVGQHEHSDARRLRATGRGEPRFFIRLGTPALGPARQQPAAAPEHLPRRLDLHPGGRDLAPTLRDERSRDRFGLTSLIGHDR
jgi:hypothetical protein